MKLWLARHARPLVAEGLCYGAMDVAADAQATAQAAEELVRILPEGISVQVSPLRRCLQLAEALRALRPGLACTPDARLAEMDFGSWEGRAWDAIGRPAFDRWMADFAQHRCGGGDSVAGFMARVRGAFDEARDTGADTLWVTHAGVARAVRLLARGIAVPRDAGEWPTQGLALGGWDCVPIDPGKTP